MGLTDVPHQAAYRFVLLFEVCHQILLFSRGRTPNSISASDPVADHSAMSGAVNYVTLPLVVTR